MSVGRTTTRLYCVQQLLTMFNIETTVINDNLTTLVLDCHKVKGVYLKQDINGNYILLGDYPSILLGTLKHYIESSADTRLIRRINATQIEATVFEYDGPQDEVEALYIAAGLLV